jgi:hypothetical protein
MVMARQCLGCSAPIPPQQGRQQPRKYCETCRPPRKRPNPNAGPVLVLHAPEDARTAPSAPPAAEDLGVVAQTHRRLLEAERLETPEGAAVMLAARALERGDYNAQGLAALIKAHAEALERATRGAKVAKDALDELRERRAQRRGA